MGTAGSEAAGVRRAVRFHRVSAALWVVLGVVAFPLGWAGSIVLVWLASVYANVKSDIGAANATDDRRVLDKLDEVLAAVGGGCPNCGGRR